MNNNTPRKSSRRTAGARHLLLLVLCLLVGGPMACSKKTPEQKLQEIQEFMKAGDTFSAIIKGKKFLEENPTAPQADHVRMMLAICYRQERDFEKVHQFLTEVYEKNHLSSPLGFNAFQMQIQTYLDERKTTAAIEMTKEALAKTDAATTGVPRARLNEHLAQLYILTGKYEQGRDLMKEMFEKEDEILQAMRWAVMLAGAAASYDDQATALDGLRQLLKRFPDIEEKVRRQDLVGFIEAIVAAFTQKQDFETAKTVYDIYLEQHPESVMKRQLQIGQAYFLQLTDKKDEAQAKFDEVLAAIDAEIEKTAGSSEKGGLVREKGKIYELMGKPDQAIELYEKYLEDFPTTPLQPQFIQAIVQAFMQKPDVDGAIAYMEEIEKKFGDQPIGQNAKQVVEQLRMMKQRMEQAERMRQQQADKDAATTGSAATTPTMNVETPPTSPVKGQ